MLKAKSSFKTALNSVKRFEQQFGVFVADRVDEVLLKAARHADQIFICCLANACKFEVLKAAIFRVLCALHPAALFQGEYRTGHFGFVHGGVIANFACSDDAKLSNGGEGAPFRTC